MKQEASPKNQLILFWCVEMTKLILPSVGILMVAGGLATATGPVAIIGGVILVADYFLN